MYDCGYRKGAEEVGFVPSGMEIMWFGSFSTHILCRWHKDRLSKVIVWQDEGSLHYVSLKRTYDPFRVVCHLRIPFL
jgi:hypothetical protein